MSELEDSFTKLLGRQPNDKERQNLYRVRDALNLKNNDALWLVLMALQYYHSQYEKFPKLIEQVATDTLADFKKTADITFTASAEATKAELAKAVAASAKEVTHQVSGKQKLQWLTGCIVGCSLALFLAGWYLNKIGKESGYYTGYLAGYNEAKDEKASAAWANTPEGKLAYRFALSGDLQMVARCQGKGWGIKNNECVPSPVNGITYGWKLPQ